MEGKEVLTSILKKQNGDVGGKRKLELSTEGIEQTSNNPTCMPMLKRTKSVRFLQDTQDKFLDELMEKLKHESSKAPSSPLVSSPPMKVPSLFEQDTDNSGEKDTEEIPVEEQALPIELVNRAELLLLKYEALCEGNLEDTEMLEKRMQNLSEEEVQRDLDEIMDLDSKLMYNLDKKEAEYGEIKRGGYDAIEDTIKMFEENVPKIAQVQKRLMACHMKLTLIKFKDAAFSPGGHYSLAEYNSAEYGKCERLVRREDKDGSNKVFPWRDLWVWKAAE